MESNAGRRDFIEGVIAAAVRRYCPHRAPPRRFTTPDAAAAAAAGGDGGGTASPAPDGPEATAAGPSGWAPSAGLEPVEVQYSSSPQGYINVAQAERVFRDVVAYIQVQKEQESPALTPPRTGRAVHCGGSWLCFVRGGLIPRSARGDCARCAAR